LLKLIILRFRFVSLFLRILCWHDFYFLIVKFFFSKLPDILKRFNIIILTLRNQAKTPGPTSGRATTTRKRMPSQSPPAAIVPPPKKSGRRTKTDETDARASSVSLYFHYNYYISKFGFVSSITGSFLQITVLVFSITHITQMLHESKSK